MRLSSATRRIKAAVLTEFWILLRPDVMLWVGLSLFVQWLHNVAHNLAYFLHRPATPLSDLGFELLPELSEDLSWVSEVWFYVIIASVVTLGLIPFFGVRVNRQRVSGILMGTRFISVCSICFVLRSISFLSTGLPGSAFHCQPGAPNYNPPKDWEEVFTRFDPYKGCGDLIFSSHTTFTMTSVLLLTRYMPSRVYKAFYWLLLAGFAVCTIASRKHYTVDVIIALYVVPLVFFHHDRSWCDLVPPELDYLAREHGEVLPLYKKVATADEITLQVVKRDRERGMCMTATDSRSDVTACELRSQSSTDSFSP